jgi:hypothetical protein
LVEDGIGCTRTAPGDGSTTPEPGQPPLIDCISEQLLLTAPCFAMKINGLGLTQCHSGQTTVLLNTSSD